MTTDAYTQWVEYTKGAAEPMLRLNELSARTLEEVARQQFDLAKDYMDLGAKQVQLLSDAKDPQKWAEQQGVLATEFGQKLMSRAEEFVALATKTQQEMVQLAEESAKKAADTPAPGA